MSASGVPRAQRHLFAALDLGKDKPTRVGD